MYKPDHVTILLTRNYKYEPDFFDLDLIYPEDIKVIFFEIYRNYICDINYYNNFIPKDFIRVSYLSNFVYEHTDIIKRINKNV